MAAMPDANEEVLAANASFYAAFAKRDLDAMEELWAREATVACLHPGWEPLLGREAVLRSWREILLGGGAPPSIRCEQAIAQVAGSTAWVVCVEVVPGGALVATNVFVHERGEWRMAHHHASAAPPRAAPSGFPN